MGIREYLEEASSATLLKINKAESAADKIFAFLSNLVDEIERDVIEKEGRRIQIQGQKVKIKTIQGELSKITGNLKRFAQRT